MPRRGRRGRAGVVVAALLMGLIAGCSSDSSVDSVEAAEKRVESRTDAVAEAQAAHDDARESFCKDAATYITAVDRYGDVLLDSAATVGDVRDGGDDLERPGDEVVASADDVVETRDELATAKDELADAEAALDAARAAEAGKSTTTSLPSTTTTTTAPLVPPATVERVKQAETDLDKASASISAATPLTEASARFNAAAVSLEVAWLRLFADAGCLPDEAQQDAEAAVRDYTVALQESLKVAGYYKDDVDGVYGPATVAAVEALQADADLPVTGYVDQATAAALSAKIGAKGGQVAARAVADTAALQQTLKLAGYWNGPVDGEWTPELTDALKALQRDLGVAESGAVDAATVAAFHKAIAETGEAEPEATTTTAAAPATTTTVAVTTTTAG